MGSCQALSGLGRIKTELIQVSSQYAVKKFGQSKKIGMGRNDSYSTTAQLQYGNLQVAGDEVIYLEVHKQGRRKRGGWGSLGCPTFRANFFLGN